MTAAPRFRPAEGPARGRIEGCDIDRENTTGLQAWTRQACGGAHSRPAGHRMAEARCADCKPGWGGRIRTCEWRIQSPLPYPLATPQRSDVGDRGDSNPRPPGPQPGALTT